MTPHVTAAMTALAIPHLSLFQIVAGLVLLAWLAAVLVIGLGAFPRTEAPPPEPKDELDLFEDWPARKGPR